MTWKFKKISLILFKRYICLKNAANLENSVIIIGDFGLAIVAFSTCKATGYGTIDYSAPELMGQTTLKSFNSKTDIW